MKTAYNKRGTAGGLASLKIGELVDSKEAGNDQLGLGVVIGLLSDVENNSMFAILWQRPIWVMENGCSAMYPEEVVPLKEGSA